MSTTNVNIRMDTEVKQQFEAFCNEMGMNMSTAFNIFARKVVREERIPFEIGRDRPNTETLAAIQDVQRMKADPSYGKGYSDVHEMMKDLLSDDV
ncbi:MAG: type II toxin-antitoxin system RelB/DinJ family antitoxin [Peptococcaceae bacterium]|nr:type II toxin-antitoxin system RelB/DinJ family antitoxin [Peptococcaceae bacterium]